MPKTDHSCRWYTESTATIYFPEGHVCCDLCPMMETYARKQCRLTGEYLLDSRVVGFNCPLKFKEPDDEK